MPEPSRKGREFERYALLATFVLIVAALVVRDQRVFAPDPETPPADPDDVMRVVLGGPDTGVPDVAPVVISGDGLPLPPPTPALLPAVLPQEEPPPPERVVQERTYVVRPGETLSQIAARELGTVRRVEEIARLNGIKDLNRVRAGQKLKLPVE